MPLAKGKSKRTIRKNFRELGKGKTYARTKRKSGKRAANKQRVAIVLSQARKSSR
jgi:hypothetical protein